MIERAVRPIIEPGALDFKIACGRKRLDTLGMDYDVVTPPAEVAM